MDVCLQGRTNATSVVKRYKRRITLKSRSSNSKFNVIISGNNVLCSLGGGGGMTAFPCLKIRTDVAQTFFKVPTVIDKHVNAFHEIIS